MTRGFIAGTGPYAGTDSQTFTGPTHFTGDVAVDGGLTVVGDITTQGRLVSALPRGYVGGYAFWSNITTPNTGAETYILGIAFTAVLGRRYKLSAHTGFLRSDNVGDIAQVRVRVDNAVSGTIIFFDDVVTPAAFSPTPWTLPLVFTGAAATAATTTAGAWPTVAAGARTLYVTMNKFTGTGNTATMIAGPSSIGDVSDIGV